MDDDVGLAVETLLVKLVNNLIVGGVTEIYHHIAYILIGTLRLSEQGLHILPHTMGLLADILGVHDLALVIDTCRTGDEHLAAVLIVHTGATLEAYTIVAGAVEVGGSVEVVNLLLLNTGDGIVVHL